MQQKTVQISRLVIGAPKGCSGKSAVTMGLLAALNTRGLKVQFYTELTTRLTASCLEAGCSLGYSGKS